LWNRNKKDGKEFRHLDAYAYFFYLDENSVDVRIGEMTYINRNIGYYEEHKNTEITLQELKSKEFQEKIKKYILVKNLVGEIK
jgi:hypothetical protein